MAEANLEHDPLFQLLTDALRAGPESPQWREAVQRVRESGGDADDFTLLCRARERLQQGREYRAVRPGPTFTRRVMSRIDEEASQAKKGVPWASVIAGGLLLIMVIAVAGVLYLLLASPNTALDETALLERPFTTVLDVQEAHNIDADRPFAIELDEPDSVSITAGDRTAIFSWNNGIANFDLVNASEDSLFATVAPGVQRVRLVIGPTLVKIQADEQTLATGEHHLPADAARRVEPARGPATAPAADESAVRILTQQ